MSLWRALHWNATTPPVFVQAVLLLSINNNNTALNENVTEILAWRLDCRLKYVWYLMLIKFVIFVYFWGKICLFLRSLWRALQSGNSPVVVNRILFVCLRTQKRTTIDKTADMFVWRLDCRLKYVCYLMLIKFVIFDYFWGKMHLFLMSLWRALQLTSVMNVDFILFFVFPKHKQQNEINDTHWYICVTVGLSSEVCLTPIANSYG